MKRLAVLLTGMAGAALLAWQGVSAVQEPAAKEANTPAAQETPAAKIVADEGDEPDAPATRRPSVPAKPSAPPPTGKVTPMAERVATVGLLNKRNGLWKDLVMKPGEARRIGDVVVRLKACETTAPWEPEHYTGAFVQVIVLGSDQKWRKYFSGWLYKESPSLNVVEHPIYDVWAKDCKMRHPDIGPETTVVRGGDIKASAGETDESSAR